ncbi:signal peptidase II [Geopsychrobacter electrodiphilus]|uniref:signal peptidase II n=1 Tax=Geopsychrobacter electrodiphilus TaxID=225196 RepID=UPI0003716070
MEKNQAASVVIAWRWWILAFIVSMADLLIKFAVSTLMPYGQSIPLTGFFNLVHVWNTGAAFSFLADAGGWQRYFFITLALGVSAWLAIMLRRPRRRTEALGYSLILGGALGNGFDRIMRGVVVDYLDFYWQNWHWPAFNLADTGIVLGVSCILLATCNPESEKQ